MRIGSVLLLAALPAAVWAQATVEYGLGVAATGTAGAHAQTTGKSIGGIFLNLTKTLNSVNDAQEKANHGSPSAAPLPRKSAAAEAVVVQQPAEPAPKPAVTYEDPAGIQKGMDRAELVRRFGEPAMQITSGAGQSLTYEGNQRRYEIEMRDGTVASVESKARPKQAAAIVLR